MADFTSIVRQSFDSGATDLRDAGLESEAFRQALQAATADGVMSEREGFDLAHAYNHGITDSNNADDDTSNDEPLLTQEEFDDVSARGTEAKGYAERARERLEEIMNPPV